VTKKNSVQKGVGRKMKGKAHSAEAAPSNGPHEMDCLGAAVVVVDRSGSVLRVSGWKKVVDAPVPRRIPPADDMPDQLLEGIGAAIDEARRVSALTRRVVAVELDKRRFYSVSAGMLGTNGDGRAAALVLEITDAFGLGPREGDSIRELAHDLRTPLASMSGAVELLESGRLGQLTPEQSRLLGMLGKGMEMMLSLIDDATARAKNAQAADGHGRTTS
jgi:phospho-acceptor domain-containing protein